ncbi:hypothetical protein [Nonomuraea sediminis]|uniref:hypothetical protein n=1 Tax=Nonomuraea sediminis TaxID=2835864 RepID=UPI001BDC1C07|nr:hypothetical protein [Nonomuraea sediminis]
MFRNALGLSLTAVLVSGGLAVPAQATPACYLGSWKLTAMKIVAKGKTVNSPTAVDVSKGGAGARLTLTTTAATYDFTGSQKVAFKDSSDATSGWNQFTGVLKVRATITGDRQGVLATSRTGATGNARGRTIYSDIKGPSWSVRANLAQGIYDGPLVQHATFTCDDTTLKMVDKRKRNGWTTVSTLQFTRN